MSDQKLIRFLEKCLADLRYRDSKENRQNSTRFKIKNNDIFVIFTQIEVERVPL